MAAADHDRIAGYAPQLLDPPGRRLPWWIAGADILSDEVPAEGEGTPQPFYERYGFVPTGDMMEGEVVLRLDLKTG